MEVSVYSSWYQAHGEGIFGNARMNGVKIFEHHAWTGLVQVFYGEKQTGR